MGFSTYGHTTKTYKSGQWAFRKVSGVYPVGGTINVSAMAAGTIIPSGSMCILANNAITIVASTDTANLANVNGLLVEDIYVEAGDTVATGAVAYAGEVYEQTTDVPATAKAKLPQIVFIND